MRDLELRLWELQQQAFREVENIGDMTEAQDFLADLEQTASLVIDGLRRMRTVLRQQRCKHAGEPLVRRGRYRCWLECPDCGKIL